jgi:hypothetical protein
MMTGVRKVGVRVDAGAVHGRRRGGGRRR